MNTDNGLVKMIPLRVLLIEDSELDAGLILRTLQDAGYAVNSGRVENEAQLLEALKENWDVFIADYRLPEFTASEALAIIQENGSDAPFIIVSGAIGEETAVALMRSGARDYLMKDKLSRLPPVVERELIEVGVRRLQQQAHEELMENERNLKHSQEVAHIGHWVMDLPSKKLFWSAEFYRIMGLDPQKFDADLMLTWQNAIHPEDHEEILRKNDLDNLLKGRGELEYRIIRPDGSIRYILTQFGEPRRDSTGQIVQHRGVVHDITERKLIELDLLEKMEESQNRARELEAITTVSSHMRQAESSTDLVIIIVKELAKLLGANRAAIAFLKSDNYSVEYALNDQELIFIQRTGKIGGVLRNLIQQKESSFFEIIPQVIYRGLPSWIHKESRKPKSMIAYPIINQSQAIGLIYLDFLEATTFNHEQRNLVEAVAEMAGNALNRMLVANKLEAMVELRERELESIYQVTSSASATLDVACALRQALSLTLEAVHSDSGVICLFDETDSELQQIACQEGDSVPKGIFSSKTVTQYFNQVIKQHKAMVVPNLSIKAKEQESKKTRADLSLIGLPMRAPDCVVGVLAVIHKGSEQVLLEEMTLLSFIADHLALVIENTRLYKKAEKSAILEERSRLARELHDSVTQSLYSASLYSAGARRFYSQQKYADVDSCLTQIGELTQQALKDMRLLVYELRSPELQRNGLIGSLQNRLDAVERRVNIQAEICSEKIDPLPEDIEENLYRIAIESLNNSLKHSQATKITILLLREKEEIVFSIEDNGIGFSIEQTSHSGGVGLATMRERAERIGAKYKILSFPQKGTKIEIRFSVNQ